jgi:flagellar biosynthesis/type III secretory pathway protein FliH
MSEPPSRQPGQQAGMGPLRALLGLDRAPAPPRAGPAPGVAEAALAQARAEGARAAEAHWQALLAAREAAHAAERAAAEARAAALLDAAAGHLAELLLAGLRAVIESAPPPGEALVRALAREALDALAEEGRGALRLSPADLASGAIDPPEGWRAVADPSLPPGEVRAEIGPRLSVASIEHRLRQLAAAMLADSRA